MTNDDTIQLSATLGERLKTRGLTLATAESCTGGGIGTAIASVDGASTYFLGGIISYATRLKTALLHVDEDTIDVHGVVSEETAMAMNRGCLQLTGADIAISVTGYAGASGGDEHSPNGRIWICVGAKEREPLTRRLDVKGSRIDNIHTIIGAALLMAINYINQSEPFL